MSLVRPPRSTMTGRLSIGLLEPAAPPLDVQGGRPGACQGAAPAPSRGLGRHRCPPAGRRRADRVGDLFVHAPTLPSYPAPPLPPFWAGVRSRGGSGRVVLGEPAAASGAGVPRIDDTGVGAQIVKGASFALDDDPDQPIPKKEDADGQRDRADGGCLEAMGAPSALTTLMRRWPSEGLAAHRPLVVK